MRYRITLEIEGETINDALGWVFSAAESNGDLDAVSIERIDE